MNTTEIQCPDCMATFAPQFAKVAEQHAAEHARLARRAADRAAADAGIRAAHGRPRGTKYAQAEMFTYSLGTPVVQSELF